MRCSRSGYIDFSLVLVNYTGMRRRLLHWLPAILLVLCQTALLVHQADIDAHAHGENCSVCLLVHGVDSALPTRFVIHIGKPVSPAAVVEQQYSYFRQIPRFYRTRAPPVSTPLVI